MTTYNDETEFLTQGGAPGFKFTTVGDVAHGTIVHAEVIQQTDMKGNAKWLDDARTKPLNQLVVTLQTELRDPTRDNDDGKRRLFIKGQMREAVGEAVKQAGAPLADGGRLAVKFVGTKPSTTPGFDPTKLYEAMYSPPPAGATADQIAETLGQDQPAQPAAGPALADLV